MEKGTTPLGYLIRGFPPLPANAPSPESSRTPYSPWIRTQPGISRHRLLCHRLVGAAGHQFWREGWRSELSMDAPPPPRRRHSLISQIPAKPKSSILAAAVFVGRPAGPNIAQRTSLSPTPTCLPASYWWPRGFPHTVASPYSSAAYCVVKSVDGRQIGRKGARITCRRCRVYHFICSSSQDEFNPFRSRSNLFPRISSQ